MRAGSLGCMAAAPAAVGPQHNPAWVRWQLSRFGRRPMHPQVLAPCPHLVAGGGDNALKDGRWLHCALRPKVDGVLQRHLALPQVLLL